MEAVSFYCSLLFSPSTLISLRNLPQSIQISFLKKERIERREEKARKDKGKERGGEWMKEKGNTRKRREWRAGQDSAKQLL